MNNIDVAEPRTIVSGLLPLIVDLDGTLIRSNLLIETCFAAIGRDSRIAFSAIRSLAIGNTDVCDRACFERPAEQATGGMSHLLLIINA